MDKPISLNDRQKTLEDLKKAYKKDTANTIFIQSVKLLEDTSHPLTPRQTLAFFGNNHPNFIRVSGREYNSMKEYDSIQQSLPAKQKDGWFARRLVKKGIAINDKYRGEPEEAFKKLGESILHRLPYMLFVSLPLFALILRLVYLRRKKYFYADHGVFTIHLYVFTFLLLLILFGLNELDNVVHSGFIGLLMFLLSLWLFVYLFIAMRSFYGQGRGKTFLKFLIVVIVSLVMMLILLLFFIFFSAFTL